jgi:predicted secreted protein
MARDGGREIRTAVGKELKIDLESNPSTGYEWEASFDRQRLKLLCSEHLPTTQAIGASGTQRFTFQAIHPGRTVVELHYKRAWEATAEKTEVVRITIV